MCHQDCKVPAGTCGVSGQQLKEWLLCHKVPSEYLQEEMAQWADILRNHSLCHVSYRALNAGRDLLTDKLPGVRPLVPGKIWMPLINKCIIEQMKSQTTKSCSPTQLQPLYQCQQQRRQQQLEQRKLTPPPATAKCGDARCYGFWQ